MERIWITSSQKLDPKEWHSLNLLQRIQRQSLFSIESIIVVSKRWIQGRISPLSEPYIRVKKGRDSQSIWQVWDPHRQETLYLSSEEQVRTWLETRYYDC